MSEIFLKILYWSVHTTTPGEVINDKVKGDLEEEMQVCV
jgi:hypothetical protein